MIGMESNEKMNPTFNDPAKSIQLLHVGVKIPL